MRTPEGRRRARRRFRPVRLALLLLILAAASLFEPNCFRFAARYAILFAAWRDGVNAQIGGIEGSLYEPLKLRNSVWIYESADGPITRVEIQTAVAEFSWRNLFSRTSTKWFQHLLLEGISGKIVLPLDSRSPTADGFKFRLPRLTGGRVSAPERIDARDVDFVFQSNSDYVRLSRTQFTLSNVSAGSITAGEIFIHQPWLTRTFREVQGTTKMEGSTIDIANFALEPGVILRDISVDLGNLARGFLNLEMEVAAFGGVIRIEAQTLSDARVFGLDATGTFSQISVAKLATFLSLSEAAGGTIKDGKFTFRGPPQHVADATASLHFEATNFQWESRQWDLLVAGATLMDGRVQIPGFALTQGHNQLSLNGEMALPKAGIAWWQSEFNVNITAKIDNLTELSALVLPDFKFAAGKANVDGSIRGKDQQFNGQIIVSGSDLQWRNAPIDEFHASVKLNGNEFQISSLSIFNDGDFVRGRGVVNIIGDKQYWGELHASILDLAKYAAILQKPLVPEPLAGGAKIEWSGEGSAKGHSGKFSARVQKLRSLGATAALMHPINAELEGTYAPGGMTFSQFALSDDESSFTANVAIGSKILSLQGIRLMNKQVLWLEGDALLPLDVWNAWPNTSLSTILDDQTVCRLNLTAHDLQLREASLLTGWKFPIEGTVNGKLSAEGAIGTLNAMGDIALRGGILPIGSGNSLSNLEIAAALDGHTLQLAKSTGRHAGGDFSATGQIDFSNLRDPLFQIAVSSSASNFKLSPGHPAEPSAFLPLTVAASLDLKVSGPLSGGKVEGSAEVAEFKFGGSLELADYLTNRGIFAGAFRPEEWPQPFENSIAPWAAWSYDVHCRFAPNIKIDVNWSAPGMSGRVPSTLGSGPPTGEMELRLGGTASNPALTGNLHIQGIPAFNNGERMEIENATWEFLPGMPGNPSVTLLVAGSAFGKRYTADIFSVGKRHWHELHTGLGASEKLTQSLLDGSYQHAVFTDEDDFALAAPRMWSDAFETYAWPLIADPEAPSALAPASAPAVLPEGPAPPHSETGEKKPDNGKPATTPDGSALSTPAPQPAATPAPTSLSPQPAPPPATPPAPSPPAPPSAGLPPHTERPK